MGRNHLHSEGWGGTTRLQKNREDFFFLFFPTEFNDWKQNSKSFINLQKEHVFSAYLIFPCVLCFTPCHHLLSICLDSKLLPDRESSQLWNDISCTRILLFSQVWNVSLWTRILVGFGAFFSQIKSELFFYD